MLCTLRVSERPLRLTRQGEKAYEMCEIFVKCGEKQKISFFEKSGFICVTSNVHRYSIKTTRGIFKTAKLDTYVDYYGFRK